MAAERKGAELWKGTEIMIQIVNSHIDGTWPLEQDAQHASLINGSIL